MERGVFPAGILEFAKAINGSMDRATRMILVQRTRIAGDPAGSLNMRVWTWNSGPRQIPIIGTSSGAWHVKHPIKGERSPSQAVVRLQIVLIEPVFDMFKT